MVNLLDVNRRSLTRNNDHEHDIKAMVAQGFNSAAKHDSLHASLRQTLAYKMWMINVCRC